MAPKPKCPDCGKPMYKSADAKSKPAKDFIHCRNINCTTTYSPVAPKGYRKPVITNVDKSYVEPTATPLPEWDQSDGVPGLVEDEPEHEAIAKTRARIRSLLETAQIGNQSATTIGIMLALLAQETGNYKAANALITEHKLDETLGLKLRKDAQE